MREGNLNIQHLRNESLKILKECKLLVDDTENSDEVLSDDNDDQDENIFFDDENIVVEGK